MVYFYLSATKISMMIIPERRHFSLEQIESFTLLKIMSETSQVDPILQVTPLKNSCQTTFKKNQPLSN